MKYSSDFFYTPGGDSKFTITEEDLDKVKRLKSFISDESGYYDYMLQWRLKDNLDVVSNGEELSRLFVVMQFISMVAEVVDTKYVQDIHINLLRRLYLEYDDYDEPVITMGFKRPFGNSNVLGDIKVEYNRCHVSYRELTNEEANNILIEFVDFLDNFYKGNFNLKLKSFRFEVNGYFDFSTRKKVTDFGPNPHSYLFRWFVDKSEIRNNKINDILDEGL
jgi:hypothetical protein